MFGLGSGLAILIDAVAVRGVLVPAAMRLLGEKRLVRAAGTAGRAPQGWPVGETFRTQGAEGRAPRESLARCVVRLGVLFDADRGGDPNGHNENDEEMARWVSCTST